jgi:myo-inositol 2-dehydrogenase/D-chiro-inositol 1-dehydrogenase
MNSSRQVLAPEPVQLGPDDPGGWASIGVIGCGLHSTTAILPSLRHAPVRLAAVCDLDVGRAELVRRRFGAESVYGSLDEMLARPDLDAVIVVGPPALHVSAGIAALESGRHVFVEKPPGSSLQDALRLQRAARAAGRKVMVGFMKRHASAYRLVRRVVSEPEFGGVTSVELTYSHWPVSGLRAQLVDMSIHALDTARWLLGEPARMAVYKRPLRGTHVLSLMIVHAGGAVSLLNLSAFGPGVQERLAVTGAGAVVVVENLVRLSYVRQAGGLEPARANARTTSCWAPEFSLPDSQNDVQVLQGYATGLLEFAGAIREGRDVSASIDDGVAAMRLIEAIIDAPDGLSVVELERGDVTLPTETE